MSMRACVAWEAVFLSCSVGWAVGSAGVQEACQGNAHTHIPPRARGSAWCPAQSPARSVHQEGSVENIIHTGTKFASKVGINFPEVLLKEDS